MKRLAPEEHFHPDALADFRIKTTFWIAIAGVFALAPFSVNNMLHDRMLLGAGATAVVVVLVLLAIKTRKGQYTNLSLLLIPPVIGFLALSIQQQGIIGVMWSYPGVVCFYFILKERWAWVANTLTIVVVVPLANDKLETAIAMRAMATLIVVSVFSILAVRVIGVQQTKLEHMAVTDSLTGLYNRSLLGWNLETTCQRSVRADEPAALLAVDIDFFKNINDTYGHLAGDGVLVDVADLLRSRLRATDTIFRTGGEEFVIVLRDTDAEPALYVAQLLRSAIAGENMIDSHPVTVSVGVASLRKEESCDAWLARADRCLYEAKRNGRNRVVIDTAEQTTTAPALPLLAVEMSHGRGVLRAG